MPDLLELGVFLAVLGLGPTLYAWRSFRARRRGLDAECLAIVSCATYEATSRGQSLLLPEHLLHAALLNRKVAAVLEGYGADPSAVRRALDEHLGKAAPPPEGGQNETMMSPAVVSILQRAGARANGARRKVSVIDLLLALSSAEDDCFAGELLARAGLCRDGAELRTPEGGDAPAPVDPSAPPYRRAATGPLVGVVVWNDSISTMEQVVTILCECFGKTEAEAVHFMMLVHHQGSVVVGDYPPEEASSLVEKATAAARALGMPLRISLSTDAGEDPSAVSGRPTEWRARLRRLRGPGSAA